MIRACRSSSGTYRHVSGEYQWNTSDIPLQGLVYQSRDRYITLNSNWCTFGHFSISALLTEQGAHGVIQERKLKCNRRIRIHHVAVSAWAPLQLRLRQRGQLVRLFDHLCFWKRDPDVQLIPLQFVLLQLVLLQRLWSVLDALLWTLPASRGVTGSLLQFWFWCILSRHLRISLWSGSRKEAASRSMSVAEPWVFLM